LEPQKHYKGHYWWVICDTKMVYTFKYLLTEWR